MERCMLCPRECGVDRLAGKRGRCHADNKVRVARAALHFWEEPCISGREGSGTVFFSGCSLGCIYCQNRAISRGQAGREVSVERLAEIFLELEGQGANNLNLVTAGHYAPQVRESLLLARKRGLALPVVYNSSGYEKVETLRMLEGLVDVYLPDFKYLDGGLAEHYSGASNYPETAKAALAEMVRQQGMPEFDSRGMMLRGVIVRHLLLPGHVREAKDVIGYLYETYGDQIYISIMNQYTPVGIFDRNQGAGVFSEAEGRAEGNRIPGWNGGTEPMELRGAGSGAESKKLHGAGSKAESTELRGTGGKAESTEFHGAGGGAESTEFHGAGGGAESPKLRGIDSGAALEAYPELCRRVTKREYGRLLDYAAKLGIVNGFYQEGGTAKESFIPPFDGQGV